MVSGGLMIDRDDHWVGMVKGIANAKGGKVFVGVDDNGVSIRGFNIGKEISKYPTMMLDMEEKGNGFWVELSYSRQKISNERINENKIAILRTLIQNPYITQTQIAQNLSLSEQYARKLMKILKDDEVIVRVGARKSGYWEVLS